jgi:hypothetical protein
MQVLVYAILTFRCSIPIQARRLFGAGLGEDDNPVNRIYEDVKAGEEIEYENLVT